MSNNYNIEVPEGEEYPTQEFVDDVLNGIDAIPTCQDLAKLRDMGEAAAKAYIAEQIDKATEKLNAMFADLKASIERRMEPIKDLIDTLSPITDPPTSIDDVIQYLEKTAQFFVKLLQYVTKPYTQMLDMARFYLQFGAAVSTALANKAADTGCIVNFAPPNISIPVPAPGGNE